MKRQGWKCSLYRLRTLYSYLQARQGFLHRKADSADEVLHFVGLDGNGRDEEDRIAQGANDESVTTGSERDTVTRAGIGRPAIGGGGLELN